MSVNLDLKFFFSFVRRNGFFYFNPRIGNICTRSLRFDLCSANNRKERIFEFKMNQKLNHVNERVYYNFNFPIASLLLLFYEKKGRTMFYMYSWSVIFELQLLQNFKMNPVHIYSFYVHFPLSNCI